MKNHLSIGHFTGQEQQALLSLKNKMVQLYQPLIVYLIGCCSVTQLLRNQLCSSQNQQENFFSCDMLLVLPNGKSLPTNAQAHLENFDTQYKQIYFTAYTIDSVENLLAKRNLFFCCLQQRAIVLYEQNHAHKKLPKPAINLKPYEQQIQALLKDYRNNKNMAV